MALGERSLHTCCQFQAEILCTFDTTYKIEKIKARPDVADEKDSRMQTTSKRIRLFADVLECLQAERSLVRSEYIYVTIKALSRFGKRVLEKLLSLEWHQVKAVLRASRLEWKSHLGCSRWTHIVPEPRQGLELGWGRLHQGSVDRRGDCLPLPWDLAYLHQKSILGDRPYMLCFWETLASRILALLQGVLQAAKLLSDRSNQISSVSCSQLVHDYRSKLLL